MTAIAGSGYANFYMPYAQALIVGWLLLWYVNPCWVNTKASTSLFGKLYSFSN